MGGQTMARREVVRLMGIAAAASAFGGFSRWSFAGDATGNVSADDADTAGAAGDAGAAGAARAANAAPSYQPQFFDAAGYAIVDALAEHIIPADDTPGARAAGVAEFIDFMVANRVPVGGHAHGDPPADSSTLIGSDLQRQWLEGIAWLEAHCGGRFGHGFQGCTQEQQLTLLTELAYPKHFNVRSEAGREFFLLVRDYTVAGYYTSRIGLESLGYAGLQSFWDQPPPCPHHATDPEHRHLPPGTAAAGTASAGITAAAPTVSHA